MPINRAPKNFTIFPNIIFYDWINKLSPIEFKILTYIHFLSEDSMGLKDNGLSLDNFAKNLNISKKGLCNGLNQLENHNLIFIIKSFYLDGGAARNQYELNYEILGGNHECSY